MRYSPLIIFWALCGLVAASGCQVLPNTRNPDFEAHLPPGHKIPNEEVKTTLPPYIIEPPDVLLIDAVKVIPKVPYLLEPLDIIFIQAENVLPDYPLQGNYQIEADGTVNLGTQYGIVKVAGLSVQQAGDAIRGKLEEELREPLVTVTLSQTAGSQQISGQHQVTPQGNVNMGTYGEVYVAGLTLKQAKAAIEKHLEQFLEAPEVMVDVFGRNSKVYYIVRDGGGLGDSVSRVPIIGGETVLDAVNGLPGTASGRIWIARPAADHAGLEQRLSINWKDITQKGITATNYQIFPGDRIVIEASPITRFGAAIAKISEPIERVSGFALLGTGAVRSLSGSFRGGQGGGGQGRF